MEIARRARRTVGLLTVLALGVALAVPFGAGAADHLDAPGLTPPGGDTRLDITDVYAFQSPTNTANTVLVMAVNPLAGVLSGTSLRPGAKYEFAVDNDGDAVEDIVYRLESSANNADIVLHRAEGAKALADEGGAVVAMGNGGEEIPVDGGGSLFVGLRDDPFFFDLNAFLGMYPFCSAPGGPAGETGVDFFAGTNVTAIVLEVPSMSLGPSNIGVWARTILDGQQIDRMGRPAINTVFIPSGSKNAFNAGEPVNDPADFGAFLGAFAPVLLPDILTVDTSNSAGFLNGRRLSDDVIDIELALITGDPDAGDCVDANDKAFLGDFPYLAGPH